jgi:hypothetical protein
MKYLICALITPVISAAAYAFTCTNYTILTPSGTATCTKCCDDNGNCTVSCF